MQIRIDTGPSLPDDLTGQFLDLERATFSTLYETCPSNQDDLIDRYSGGEITAVLLLDRNELIGARVFRRLTQTAMESMAMMVGEPFRGRRLANLICSASASYFEWLRIEHITSWTHVDITAAQIMERWAPFVSVEDELAPIEAQLLRCLERQYNKPDGLFGTRRRVPKYYRMVDGSYGDAFFWVHELPHSSLL